MVIEEGKKALNREIVIMGDAKEDEVDDSSGTWEEEQAPSTHAGPSSISRSSSAKRARRPILSPNTFESPSLPSIPSKTPTPHPQSQSQ
jgi:hypothetical protein